ncbi:ester cyclase [Arcticibacter tournemirensis]|uniref:Ester cyclase n=1 Tax=Arcticibacter tournemirensis TaxID=699437 RepID=A0A5M9H7I1_9SPHI|nr:ester cyclase [Arcticibacter tournemirensis]KAA8482902.1 ester cyclase [Arcticibacter tournemirensis]
MDSLATRHFYQRYIDCLNNRSLGDLDQFVSQTVIYNQNQISLKDYQEMLTQNFRDIPDLYFHVDLLLTQENEIACRLNFSCTPVTVFMGIPVHGQKVSFSEHVFYRLAGNKISEVWSLIDKDAIRDQIKGEFLF